MNKQHREILFWNDVDVLVDKNKCWNWKLSVDRNGYGKVKMFGKVSIAHRIAYQLWFRVNPGRMHVLHACDNPRCCNPFHLWIGTHLDNVRDMDRKGRRKNHYGYNRKINYEIAEEIRNRFDFGESKSSLARSYGLDPHTIRDIISRVSWKHPPAGFSPPLSAPEPSDGRKTGESGGVGA